MTNSTIAKQKYPNATAQSKADYICREGKWNKGKKAEELFYREHGNMPAWAQDNPREFWKASEEFESAKGGTSYRELEFALPNELTLKQQIELTRSFVAEHFGKDFVYTYAIHSKNAAMKNGVKNPHAHIIFCDRKLDGIQRNRQTFFKRADKKNPERGGAVKDRDRWTGANRDQYLKYMRHSWAELQNMALEKHAHPSRVDHRTLKSQREAALQKGDFQKAKELNRLPQVHLGEKIVSKLIRQVRFHMEKEKTPEEKLWLRREYYTTIELIGRTKYVANIRELNRVNQKINQQEKNSFPEKLLSKSEAQKIATLIYIQKESKPFVPELQKIETQRKQFFAELKNHNKEYQGQPVKIDDAEAINLKQMIKELKEKESVINLNMAKIYQSLTLPKVQTKINKLANRIIKEEFKNMDPRSRFYEVNKNINTLSKEKNQLVKQLITPQRAAKIALATYLKYDMQGQDKIILEEAKQLKKERLKLVAAEKKHLQEKPNFFNLTAKKAYERQSQNLKEWDAVLKNKEELNTAKLTEINQHLESPAVKIKIEKITKQILKKNEPKKERYFEVVKQLKWFEEERKRAIIQMKLVNRKNYTINKGYILNSKQGNKYLKYNRTKNTVQKVINGIALQDDLQPMPRGGLQARIARDDEYDSLVKSKNIDMDR